MPASGSLPKARVEGSPLSTASLVAFGLPNLVGRFQYMLLLVMYLNFAADRLGAAVQVVGGLWLASKVWDAVSDPMAGYWSDRTQSRWGRRKPWIAASAVPLAVFACMLWAPPSALSEQALHVWIGVSLIGFFTAFTALDVPHMALGAEISLDPQQRNRVYASRQLAATIGMFAAGTAGPAIVSDPETGRAGALWLSLALGLLTLVLIPASVAKLPRERAEFMGRGPSNPLKAVRDVWTNRRARLLLFVFFIESFGLGAVGVLVPFVLRYVMEMPALTGPMLGLYMVAGLLGIPLWVVLARRFEKRRLWLFAMVQGGVGFGILFWLDVGTWGLMAVSSVLAGSAGACGNTLGQALKAEVIDCDEYDTGERKEGAYFAAWSFVGKLAGGLVGGAVGLVLGSVGYVPNQPQTEAVRAAMVFLMGGLPMLGYAIGAAAFARFDLSEAEHARIRADLDARATQGA